MRKTKIVSTLGPACDDENILRQMIRNGINVARSNFSHGDFEEHGGRIEKIRRISKEEGKTVALLLDTKGPEIRTGVFKEKGTMLVEGSEVIIRHDDIEGTATEFSCTYKQLHQDVKEGDIIMIDDGLIELDVTKVVDKDVYTVVRNEGPVSTYKGMNLPGIKTNLPALTDKDIEDLKFGIEMDYDFVAASFIRTADDVEEIRRAWEENGGGTDIKIISKIENQEGVDNIDEIIAASDGIMVARGDLGVEVAAETLPAIQKYITRRCREEGKFCIVATQMLDSMQSNPRPTRAEVSDVANSIYDGTGSVMLSGESANGDYPAESVEMQSRIAIATENDIDYAYTFETENHDYVPSVSTALAQSAVASSFDLEADAIIMISDSVEEAGQLSKFRAEVPVIVATTNPRTQRQNALHSGVTTLLVEEGDVASRLASAKAQALELELLDEGSLVIELTSSADVSYIDTMKIVTVSRETALTGTGHGRGEAVGIVYQVAEGLDFDFVPVQSVLVADEFTAEDTHLVRYAKALVQEKPELNETLQLAINKNMPVVTGVKDATTTLISGDLVTVSAEGTIK